MDKLEKYAEQIGLDRHSSKQTSSGKYAAQVKAEMAEGCCRCPRDSDRLRQRSTPSQVVATLWQAWRSSSHRSMAFASRSAGGSHVRL